MVTGYLFDCQGIQEALVVAWWYWLSGFAPEVIVSMMGKNQRGMEYLATHMCGGATAAIPR